MDNKYLYMVMAGVGASLWFYVGYTDYYNADGSISNGWWFATILAVGLGAGDTGGDDLVSVLMESIKGFVPQLITLAAIGVIITLAYQVAMAEGGFNAMGLVHSLAVYVAAGVLTSITLSFAKRSAA